MLADSRQQTTISYFSSLAWSVEDISKSTRHSRNALASMPRTGLRQVIAMVSHGLGSVETERQSALRPRPCRCSSVSLSPELDLTLADAVCRLAIGSFEELVAHLVLQQSLKLVWESKLCSGSDVLCEN